MSLAIIYSRASAGIYAPPVTVETHITFGLPRFSIVGLPETVVKESKDRVRSALLNANFDFPTMRITVNLAPADLPKDGGRFDLPIALGILAASGQIPKTNLDQFEFAGELALTGELRTIQGILPFALGTQRAQRHLIIPKENALEAALIGDVIIIAAQDLLEVCGHVNGQKLISPFQRIISSDVTPHDYPDLSDVKGQQHAKRALEIAAAGGHSLLLIGPPGTGKSMLASRLRGLLPTMSHAEAVEVAAITSISSTKFALNNWCKRPYRTPHHTASCVALVGGGNPPRPGEISLAHQGILFLDELPEFDRRVLEALREPLETGTITISRAAKQAEFPAQFQLIAAMNPCPCGYLSDPNGRCRCSYDQIQRYRARLSGPLLDRIDMTIEVPRLPEGMLTATTPQNSETSIQVRARVEEARKTQLKRSDTLNSSLSTKQLEAVCILQESNRQLLENAIKKLSLSARAYHRILRVARSIADLVGHEEINTAHLMEALSYRRLETATVLKP